MKTISKEIGFGEFKSWVNNQSNNTLDVVIKNGIYAFFPTDGVYSPYEVHNFNGNWEMIKKSVNFENYTPHAIKLNDGTTIPNIPGREARVANVFSAFDENLIATVKYGEVEGLPEPKQGTIYIVSAMVLAACPNRNDLVAPATGHPDCVRENGRIVSVPGFVH